MATIRRGANGQVLTPIENAYSYNGLQRSDRYDTSQLIRTGPNSFRDADGNVYDGLGRVPLPGQSTGMQRAAKTAGGGGGAGGPGDIPGASVMGQQVAAGLAEYKKALARLNQNRTGTLTQYGYAGEIDPETGVLKNMRVDSSNPFGVYQGMRRNNAFQYSDLRDQRMERGLGAKGLGAQGMDRARYEWGAADTAMAQALTGTLSGFDQQQQGAWQDYQNLLWQMQLEAARAAADEGDYGYNPDYGDYPEDGPGGPGEDPVTGGAAARYPGLPKAMRPVKIGGKWRGAWGPAPSKAQRKIIGGIASVKPGRPRIAIPQKASTPAKAKAINKAIAAANKKKGGKR